MAQHPEQNGFNLQNDQYLTTPHYSVESQPHSRIKESVTTQLPTIIQHTMVPPNNNDLTLQNLSTVERTAHNVDAINLETQQIKGHLNTVRQSLDELNNSIDSLDGKITNISKALDVSNQLALQKHPGYFLFVIFLFFLVISLWQDVFGKTVVVITGKKEESIITVVVLAIAVSLILWIAIVRGGTSLFTVETSV